MQMVQSWVMGLYFYYFQLFFWSMCDFQIFLF